MSLALITGGAHRLGAVFAEHLARRGYNLLIHYHRSAQPAEFLAAQLRETGVRAWTFGADLRRPDEIEALFAYLDSLDVPLALLINSAATMPESDLRQISAAEWDETLALNLRAPMLCAQRAAARMTDGGLILHLSDTGARKTWTKFPAYTVSKAALETLTRLQARAFAPLVRVNALAPGLVLPADDFPPADWERLLQKTPAGRAVRPDELTAVLDYLLAAPSVTGQVLVVDGGYALI